jgi:hypothetical protein
VPAVAYAQHDHLAAAQVSLADSWSASVHSRLLRGELFLVRAAAAAIQANVKNAAAIIFVITRTLLMASGCSPPRW